MSYVYGPATSSGEKSISAAITSRPSMIHGFDILPPSIGLATLKIYDGTSASGTIIAEITVAAGQNAISMSYVIPRLCNTALYASLSGTTTYVIGYSLF